MKLNRQINKRHLAMVCVVLILAYVSIVLIPHAHECGGVNCADCAMLQTSRNALIALSMAAMFCGLVRIVLRLLFVHTRILEARQATPVGLKVKLSD